MEVPPLSLDGLFHGKSESKMDDMKVSLFQETSILGSRSLQPWHTTVSMFGSTNDEFHEVLSKGFIHQFTKLKHQTHPRSWRLWRWRGKPRTEHLGGDCRACSYWSLVSSIYSSIIIPTCTYIYIYIHIYIYISICVYIYIYIHMCIYIYM